MAQNASREQLDKRVKELEKEVTRTKRVDEALRESEERYRAILENIEEGYYEVDLTGNFTYFNESFCEITGYVEHELMAANYRQFTDQDTAKKVYKVFNRVYTSGEPVKGFTWAFTRRDGTVRHIDTSVSLMRDREGKPIGFRGIIRDVTDRIRAEAALRESEEIARALLNASTSAAFLIDTKGIILAANEIGARALGKRVDEIIGLRLRDFFPTALADKRRNLGLKVIRTGRPCFFEDETQGRYFENTIYPVFDEHGNVTRLAIYGRDITERKRAQQALQDGEAKYRELVQNANSIILRFDTKGQVTFINEFAQSFFGYTESEILGKNVIGTIVPETDSSGRDLAAMIRELLQNPERFQNNENENMRRTGERVWVYWTNKAITDQSGNTVGILAIGNDITDRKRLEEQLRQAQKMEALGTLAGGVAHDFNNLLMGILGNASLMLLHIDENHSHYERLKRIEEQVQRGSKLTSQLLGYARKGKYEVKPLDLNQLVSETSETFGRTRKEIVIHRDLEAGLMAIEADKGQMEQVLFNLYVNAADAMPTGGELTLSTGNVSHQNIRGKLYHAEPGEYVLLTVSDAGIGMDGETMERIFDPFFTTKEMGTGTGLGLSSAYGIVKSHGGYIDVESERGKGTTFRIYLPATKQALQEPSNGPERLVPGKETILIVDDEEIVLEVGVRLLEALGYKVLQAPNGKEAIDIYESERDKIALVILDMVMPHMGGGATYDRLKRIDPNVKVILSSGYSIDGQAREIMERGCDGFIQKPFRLNELSEKIREILGKKARKTSRS